MRVIPQAEPSGTCGARRRQVAARRAAAHAVLSAAPATALGPSILRNGAIAARPAAAGAATGLRGCAPLLRSAPQAACPRSRARSKTVPLRRRLVSRAEPALPPSAGRLGNQLARAASMPPAKRWVTPVATNYLWVARRYAPPPPAHHRLQAATRREHTGQARKQHGAAPRSLLLCGAAAGGSSELRQARWTRAVWCVPGGRRQPHFALSPGWHLHCPRTHP